MAKGKKVIDQDSMTAELLVKEEAAHEKMIASVPDKARRKLVEPYTDGLPYDRDRVVVVARERLYDSYTNAIECGKYLIWLQLEEGVQPVGQIFNQYFPNVSRATLYNFMRLARIAVEHPKMKILVEKHRSKVIALFEILDEEDIEALESGEEVAGMVLDDVEKTPKRELMQTLRTYKKQNEKGKEQLTKADDTIRDLKAQIHDIQNPKPYSSEEEKWLDEIREIRQKFDSLILKTRLISKNSAQVVHNLYFLHGWITWTASQEMLELRKDHDKLEEMPWEMDPYGIPPIFQDIADAIEKSAELKAQRKTARNK